MSMCVLTGLVVCIIVGINVTIEWIGKWQQQGHLSKLQIDGLWQWRIVLLNCYVENESAIEILLSLTHPIERRLSFTNPIERPVLCL